MGYRRLGICVAAAITGAIGCLAVVGRPAPLVIGHGNVSFLIRGPQGQPVRGRTVIIRGAKGFPSAPFRKISRTNRNGWVAFHLRPGVVDVRISVPKLGYTRSGRFLVNGGPRLRRRVCRLAPYAKVMGHIKRPFPRGVRVTVRPFLGFHARFIKTHGNGRFTTYLPRGRWVFTAARPKGPEGFKVTTLSVQPGQTRRHVALQVAPRITPAQAHSQTLVRAPLPGQHKTVTYVEGLVRTAVGVPVAGATVYEYGVFYGGLRNYSQALKTTTDAHGHYAIRGTGGLMDFSGAVVAARAGTPPAWTWFTDNNSDEAWVSATSVKPPPAYKPAQRNLVLAAHGGTLRVTVLRRGKPVKSGYVVARLEGANLKDQWAAPTGGPAAIALRLVAYPQAKVNVHGMAVFHNLVPGRYSLQAGMGTAPQVRQIGGWMATTPLVSAFATGVPVVVGRVNNQVVSVFTHPVPVHARFCNQAGQALVHRGGFYTWHGVKEAGRVTSASPVNAQGVRAFYANHCGFRVWSYIYRRQKVQRMPVQAPYYASRVIIAVAPQLKAAAPMVCGKLVTAGTVRVELRNSANQAVRGAVTLAAVGDNFAGATNRHGVITFRGVPPYPYYTLHAYAPGERAVSVREYGQHLPARRALAACTEFLPISVVVSADSRQTFVMRLVHPAFIRGVLRPAPGKKLLQYSVYATAGENSAAQTQYDSTTGKFVAGPFSGGTVHVRVEPFAIGAQKVFLVKTAPLQPGVVHNMVLRAPVAAAGPKPVNGTVLVGAGGVTLSNGQAGPLTGSVYLADGHTPAYGAIVERFLPQHPSPAALGLVDAAGKIRSRSLPVYIDAAHMNLADQTVHPRIVALLPGQTGAVVLRRLPGQHGPLHIVLPPPISARGTVTMGGKAPMARRGAIRVLAAYQGKLACDSALNITVTANANGSFTLAGLTPGRYRVQACFNNIYLSNTVTMTVRAGKLRRLHLAIPAPGRPVIATVLTAAGKPALGASLRYIPPTGPLQGLWPRLWKADGAGRIYFPTLPAGGQTIGMGRGRLVRHIHVPPLPGKPLRITIRIPAAEARR